jgi:homospermidine synthase
MTLASLFSATKYAPVSGRLLMLGFGSVGQAVLPLLLRHLAVQAAQISIISASDAGIEQASNMGVALTVQRLTEDNWRAQLTPRLAPGDMLLNLSVGVCSLSLMTLCRQRGALYLDTCIEPWAGTYTDGYLSPSQRSNYALREQALAFGRAAPNGPTAVLTQGANPGLVSSLVKQALLNMAHDADLGISPPRQRQDWAALAQRLSIRTIHIAERDSQAACQHRRAQEFVNTWSVDGFISEGLQPSELGWGSHERHWPADAMRHGYGCDAAIYLNRPGMATQVRSWTPLQGAYQGFLVTHGESISIADHLTLQQNGALLYRPTVHYAYLPCDDAQLSIHDMAGRNWQAPPTRRILRQEIQEGLDELGVLLMGNSRGVYWLGSRLSIQEARNLAPYNSATSLQVAAGVLAGVVWALQNPQASVVEPDDLDPAQVLAIARPYLGELVGVYADWSPLQGRSHLFQEDLDLQDPWQFKNFRVQ